MNITRTTRFTVAGVIAGIAFGVGATFALMAVAGGDNDGGLSASDRYEDRAAPAATTPPYQPVVTDFAVSVSITEQQCFGSAGCNVTAAIVPDYVGTSAVSGNWSITYELIGIENGPLIQTFELRSGTLSFTPEVRFQIPAANTPVTANITRVATAY